MRVTWIRRSVLGSGSEERLALLNDSAVLGIRGALSRADAAEAARRVWGARDRWTPDFGGEQFCLGRAFYAHLETGRSREYFAGAAAADALVEATLPGAQRATRELLECVVGAHVRQRPGFCGPGVHVFPALGQVARAGGVTHFDLEGLTEHQLSERARAITLVLTLSPAARGGGLRVWDTRFEGRADTEIDADAFEQVTIRAGAGDALVIDSRRLHQIRPFSGELDRITITAHAAQLDRSVWEMWF